MVKPTIEIFINSNKTNSVNGDIIQENVGVKLKNIMDFEIVDSVDLLTSTAMITIPSKVAVFKQGNLYLKSNQNASEFYEIKTGLNHNIAIYSGYGFRRYNIFRGYVTEIKNDGINCIIKCEDEMYALKNSGTHKGSFPSPLKDNIIDSAFNGQPLEIKHLLYKLFNFYGVTFPIYCNDIELGKIKINDFFNIAEILDILKERFGIFAYFKNQLSWNDRQNVPIDGRIKAQPTLYVGYKYWEKRVAIDINTMLRTKTTKTVIIKDSAFFHKFMYPYKIENDGDFNRIIDFNLEWVKTDKDKLIVEITSPQDTKLPITYVYPENVDEQKRGKFIESFPDNSSKDAQTSYAAKNTPELKDDEYAILTNDKPNQIKINIPNLDLYTMKKMAKEAYDNYLQSGYTGNFVTFCGYPLASIVQKGDVVRIRFADLNNTGLFEDYSFYVSKVVYKYDTSQGLTQDITIDIRYYPEDLLAEANRFLQI